MRCSEQSACRGRRLRRSIVVALTIAGMSAVLAPAAGATIWRSATELTAQPLSGVAWTSLAKAADGSLGTANVADQNSAHDMSTLAAALAFQRTGAAAYRTKAAVGIAAAIGTERGGRVLALGRNLAGYVVAAEAITLAKADPALNARFRAWLSAARSAPLDGRTLISVSEERPNNWGTMAGASRVAADVYLGDGADLARAATVFRGYLGERAAYAGFRYGSDLSWQADPKNPVGINPAGAVRNGFDVDGALPDEMRRGCSLRADPCFTDYAWEALQGAVVEADILARNGYAAWSWGNRALLRAAAYLDRLDRRFGGWWAKGDDTWQPWVINRAYGTSLRTAPARSGKIMGFTDWTHAR